MSLSHCCRLFEISRQGFYQMIKRKELRAKELQKVKHLVQQIRMIIPKLGIRKLYFLLKDEFEIHGILKNEFLIYKCKNFKELRELIKESIHIYNEFRPHLSLNMKTPNFVHNNKKPEEINPLALL